MFEKFTQKAIDIVQEALNCALKLNHDRVMSEHLLMSLITLSKGVQAKILNFDKINIEKLENIVKNCTKTTNNRNIIFSKEVRTILKKALDLSNELNSKFIMPQHIALAILLCQECGSYRLIKHFDIDETKIISNLKRMLDKSSDIKINHPEDLIENTQLSDINNFFKEDIMSEILANAKAKLSTKGYEIVGTEQILQSILDNKNYKIVEILEKYNLNSEIFAQKLSQIDNRNAEFENSAKQIIFTPNAFLSLMNAIDYAKESGSVNILPEHIIMGVLKSKRGIAYHILSSIISPAVDFEDTIIRQLNDKTPETLAILRLAKEEARSLNSSVIGTEMILLGILSYGAGVGADTLRRLGINYKDAKKEIEKLIKPQKENNDLIYSQRAKKTLEIAYETAKKHKKNKIKSENLLYGITKIPNCLAMQVLSNLGTDVLEIQQGIKQELLGGMDL